MPKAIYMQIYKVLKERIEREVYEYQEMLPSENTLIQEFNCSINTIRRAIGELVNDGYVQAMQGKGVRNIYQPSEQNTFVIGGIESFKESAIRNKKKARTEVLQFAELIVDEKIGKRTGFEVGEEIYYIQRLHYMDDKALILNHNYFLKNVANGLTKEIAEKSIYDYLENTLGITIVNSKRVITVEKMTQIEENLMDLGDYNCLAVVSSQTFNSDGVMFEYTESRHRPDYFRFQENAVRKK
jgi:GntR family trehalose operon transcriptional repressor